MMKDLKKRQPVQNPPEHNRISAKASDASVVSKVRKRIYRQAALIVMTAALTVVILFAMTSAWYTNVVQTSGLTFETESWGFEGKITVGNEAVVAAPGDEGIIDLTVENANDSVSTISVNVDKKAMTDEMEKRLYFYVDTRMNRNGETMDRVYLNRFEGYTYNMFNNSRLTLTKEFSNGPVIKWEWVYDVLGYYVMGKPYDAGNERLMDVKEYLRPIIYDYDKATTLISTKGESITAELETVDGVRTPEQFLAELSLTDGYEGELPENVVPTFDNYYAIDVDADGYGVYAYLCNYSEIQEEIRYDAKLGELAYKQASGEALTDEEKEIPLHYSATLTLSAQKEDSTVTTIGTPGALQDAITLGIADVIQLSGDMTVAEGETIVIPENRRVTVDLNGKEITNKDGVAIAAMPGSSLTLINGTLQQADQSETTDPATTYGVRAVGAEVVMSHMVIEDFQHGVYVGDNADSNTLDSRVHIMNSTITAKNCAAFIAGNGLLSEQKSLLVIEDSTLSGSNIVVAGNGDANGNGRWGTDIQILNSKIIGIPDAETGVNGVGIYQPQKNSTLLVKDSTVEGSTGIALKGGSAKIDHSTIVGNGLYTEPSVEGSGFTNTGDAIYIENSYGYEIQLLVNGSSSLKATHEKCLPCRVFEENAANVTVEIEEPTDEATGEQSDETT